MEKDHSLVEPVLVDDISLIQGFLLSFFSLEMGEKLTDILAMDSAIGPNMSKLESGFHESLLISERFILDISCR